MRSIWQDVQYALRQLRKAPGFAFTAVTVLALGIGANIAVFTVLSGILLRPLPYVHPDRVVTVELSGPMPYYSMTYANMLQLRDAVGQNVEFGAVMCCGHIASVVGPGGRVQISQQDVTAGLPRMLGLRLLAGRMFRDEENDPGRNRVLLIGEDVWRNLYHSDPRAVGQTLTIKKQTYTIIGVMPAHLAIPYDNAMEVWSPAPLNSDSRSSMSPKMGTIGTMYARLPDGMTAAQLAANMSRTQARIAKKVSDGELPTGIKVTDYRKSIDHEARKPLLLLYAVVLGIWMLACLNVTSLMLARAVARSREQAVRAALGASGKRLVQQVVVESLMLSGIGSLAGLALGQSAIKLLWRQIAHKLPLTSAVHVDWRVVSFLAALTLFTAVIAGVFPAFRAMRRDVCESLRGVNTTASAGANRTREALVVAQLSLTLVFLVGAGLFLRTIHALRQVPLGFAQQNVLTGGIILNGSSESHQDDQDDKTNIVTAFYRPLLDRLNALPGVRAAALSSVLPLRAEFGVTVSGDLDHKEAPRGKEPVVDGRLASPGLVEALGIPMIRGRFFTEDDTASSPPVVVVNQAFVNRFLAGQDPIGHTFGMDKKRFAEMRIVGVIGDMKQLKVTDDTKQEIYFCLAQMEPGTPLYGIATAFIQVAIRSRVSDDTLRAQFDKVLHEVAPDAATTDVMTIHEAVEDSFGGETLVAQLLQTFAALALMIAAVGLYGLLSFVVAQRTREIGVRIALGAPQFNILNLVLRRAFLMVGIGLAIGGVLAWFAAALTSSYIFGVQAHDAFTFTAVVVVLATASLISAWLPARRAAAVDPILALRSE